MEPKDYIIGKVNYDPNSNYVFDSQKNIILEIRGWGRISGMFDDVGSAENFQDLVGKFIEEAINEKLKNSRNG